MSNHFPLLHASDLRALDYMPRELESHDHPSDLAHRDRLQDNWAQGMRANDPSPGTSGTQVAVKPLSYHQNRVPTK